MERKLRHPIVVYTAAAARVAYELTRMHQLTHQLSSLFTQQLTEERAHPTSSLQTHTCEVGKVTYIASCRDLYWLPLGPI